MSRFISMLEAETGSLWLCLLPLFVAFFITVTFAPVFIPWLKKLKFGQEILEIGPNWHKVKEGTPTMGGIMFILGITIAVVVMLIIKFDIKLLMMLLISVGFGVIGFTDDYIKVVKKRNLGLTARQKFALQMILSIIYVVVLKETGNLDNNIIIPFVKKTITMPWWLNIAVILFVVTGTVNAVNLTDGIDGLATSITIAVSIFFWVAGAMMQNISSVWFSLALIGGLMAFLMFNKHPAKVFMGDTGSLFLGGSLSVLAIGMKMPLILVIVGFVYLFETLSVIIQVTSFKLRKKRVFKMTPIHHHFEMCGWKETKIVTVFTSVTVLLCIIGVLSLMPYFMAR